MVARRLKSGATAYYWVLPTWAKRSGCTLQVEALGLDYSLAKQRCDEVLNPQFDAWRKREQIVYPDRAPVGTFDWMITHNTAAMTALYTKQTMRQRRAGARKRLEERTKGGNLSK
jgi:hypothetical protein